TAVAIVFVVFGQIQSYVAYPSTGPLRFGPPYLVLLLEVLACRQPGRRLALERASAGVTVLASLWSFEAFAYTLGTYLAILGVEAVVWRPRARETLRRRLLPVAAGFFAVQAAFAAATRSASGSWPDWATYLDFIR